MAGKLKTYYFNCEVHSRCNVSGEIKALSKEDAYIQVSDMDDEELGKIGAIFDVLDGGMNDLIITEGK